MKIIGQMNNGIEVKYLLERSGNEKKDEQFIKDLVGTNMYFTSNLNQYIISLKVYLGFSDQEELIERG